MTDRRYLDDPGARRRRNWRIALAIVVSLALFVALLLFAVTTLTRPVVDAGDSFMTALKSGDFPRAYALAAPELQRELGSAQRLGAGVEPERPAEWGWSSRSIRNGTGRVSGAYTRLDGVPRRALLVMRKVDGEWRITAFRFGPD